MHGHGPRHHNYTLAVVAGLYRNHFSEDFAPSASMGDRHLLKLLHAIYSAMTFEGGLN